MNINDYLEGSVKVVDCFVDTFFIIEGVEWFLTDHANEIWGFVFSRHLKKWWLLLAYNLDS